jgi:NitT/TauT family transport system substrate-binding protein
MRRGTARALLLCGAVLVLCVGATACGGDDEGGEAAGGGQAAELPLIKFSGLAGGTSSVALKVIEENGFDTKNGFRGEYSYQDPDAANQFFFQRQADVAFDIDVLSVAIARSRGINVTSIGSVVTNHICLFATKDSSYSSAEQLAGKKVGHYGTDSGGTVALAILMDQAHGIDIFEDWELVESDPSALLALLNRGDLDASVAFQPNIALQELQHGSKCISPYFTDMWEELEGAPLYISTIAAHDEWIEGNPELARNVLAAWQEGHQWLSENPDALTRTPYKELTGVDDPAALERFAELVNEIPMYTSSWTAQDIAAQEAFVDLAAEQGTLIEENPGGATTQLDAE